MLSIEEIKDLMIPGIYAQSGMKYPPDYIPHKGPVPDFRPEAPEERRARINTIIENMKLTKI